MMMHSEQPSSQSHNDRCSAIARAWAATTWADLPQGGALPGGFAHAVPASGKTLAITSDGIGTKVEIAERMGRYDTLGFDLVAMVVDDLAAAGARPTALANVLDVDRFDESAIDALMRGLAAAARVAGVVVAGGEIARLGSRICGYGEGMHFNWCATAVSDVSLRPAASDRTLQDGDVLIALSSDGFRSNGYTLARSILNAEFGSEWHGVATASGRTWGDVLLTPSRIYAPAVVAIAEAGVPLLACAHVTGGGVPGNLPRVLGGCGLRAKLHNLPRPHAEMRELIEIASVRPHEAYEQWNMGTGFLCAVPPEAADAAIGVASEHGAHPRIAGTVSGGRGIYIDARAWGMGELTFEAPS